jgi:hypothetical protein
MMVPEKNQISFSFKILLFWGLEYSLIDT